MKEADVEKVASLARLKINKDELEMYVPQLKSIVSYFEKISQVNTEGVEPLVTPTDMEVIYREDVLIEFDGAADALDQAPEKMGNLFKVPPVV